MRSHVRKRESGPGSGSKMEFCCVLSEQVSIMYMGVTSITESGVRFLKYIHEIHYMYVTGPGAAGCVSTVKDRTVVHVGGKHI